MYDWQDIESDVPILLSHAGVPWTGNYQNISRNIACVSDRAIRFECMTARHTNGFAGTANDPEVMRLTQMLEDVKTSGRLFGNAITQLELQEEMLNDECKTILGNMRSMVTFG